MHPFVARKKVGILLRTFAQKEEDVPKRVQLVEQLVERAMSARSGLSDNAVSRVSILVWSDQRYKDAKTKPDCGRTSVALRDRFSGHAMQKIVRIHEVCHGDLFCALLNYGVAQQLREGIDYSIIISPEAFSYLAPDTLGAMIDAASNSALAIGVAINELTESVLEGRLANTFAMWHNESLLTVGGFDCRAELPVEDRFAYYLRGWDGNAAENFVLAGVEEVRPLARLVDAFGPCIAPVRPIGGSYAAPNRETEPDLWNRHMLKMASKYERQATLLAGIGYRPSFLKYGVMPQYRDSSVFAKPITP